MNDRPEPKSRVIALVSGLDSCIMTALLTRTYKEVTPLFIRSGLKWEDAELSALSRFFQALDSEQVRSVAELEFGRGGLYSGHWSTGGQAVPDAMAPDSDFFLPGRNLLLLSVAATYGSIVDVPNIAIGILKSNPFPDATPEFLRSLERSAGLALDREFRVLTPLHDMQKSDVLRAGRSFPIELSLSCADPVDGEHCGICGKCGERRRGFIDAEVPDRTTYKALGPL